MLNHRKFGGLLMGAGIALVGAYFAILLISTTWAMIIAVSVLVSVVGMMFFWLGFKVVRSSQMSKEVDESEKV